MVQNVLIKILLMPISLLYGLGVSIRNGLYKQGFLKGFTFNLPVISVGNLTVGGAGKSPHIEMLIRLLNPYINIATLSRGYGRKSKGYLEINKTHNAEQAGDEPLQFKRKFPDVLVTVAESRSLGIPKIIQAHPNTQTVLLDDAFQHLAINPSLNILLTEYAKPFSDDFLLPSGRLREWRSSYVRANVIIISKCPPEMTLEQKDAIIQKIKPLPTQKVFFTYYEYENPHSIFNPEEKITLTEEHDIVLNCAIAGTDYLLSYLDDRVNFIKMLEYEDHHYFSNFEVAQLGKIYQNLPSSKKIILTTEKDAMRLEIHKSFLLEKALPVYVLPIKVAFHFEGEHDFENLVRNHLLEFKR